MKRNLLALVALVAAFTLSSFTGKTLVSYYLVYDGGTADQRLRDSYSSADIFEAPDHLGEQSGPQILNWIRVEDADLSDAIENDEVEDQFDIYNVGVDGDNLNDEIDIPGSLDIKDVE
ncbi:hypothetical protein GFS24_12010 [Chitinophaga sp. SYP-B3965]|uniref:hypothetical protein n=1 Tax=Chitinophaga sp. SYP-B3965 TaxID=2663120 RepID=UPI00129981AD|nr:hypothetical protein [Chitinophaga sp. SYP-B3965]MRG45844.1 hypothetical protein [Chitinophaga sp. SYP-B3965]